MFKDSKGISSHIISNCYCCNFLQNCLSCCIASHFRLTVKERHTHNSVRPKLPGAKPAAASVLRHQASLVSERPATLKHEVNHHHQWRSPLQESSRCLFVLTKPHISSSSCGFSVFDWRPKPFWWPPWKCLPRAPDTLPNTRGRALHSSAAGSPHPASKTIPTQTSRIRLRNQWCNKSIVAFWNCSTVNVVAGSG